MVNKDPMRPGGCTETPFTHDKKHLAISYRASVFAGRKAYRHLEIYGAEGPSFFHTDSQLMMYLCY